ncbi:DUF4214 domain-containing protein (plasmid) [Massilia varians]|jgi:uncharacterized protein YkwD|uniref:DUF4214 domain-containing protein n=1 Tax=Massilia sp. X63 TaxID=3237285 RepID=UPI0034DD37D0
MQMKQKLNAALAMVVSAGLAGCGGQAEVEEARMASVSARTMAAPHNSIGDQVRGPTLLDAPVVTRPVKQQGMSVGSMSNQSAQVVGGVEGVAAIDTTNREAVRKLFAQVYMKPPVPMGWTGSHEPGAAGSISREYQLSTIERINWYRAMAGLPAAVPLSSVNSVKAQQAAFVMSQNGALSHSPTADWAFYTLVAAEAAAASNMALGYNGPDAIDTYMKDPGDGNYGVGHRRFLLNPAMKSFGVGDVPGGTVDGKSLWAGNAVWVLDADFWGPRPHVRDGFVAWPARGYVPYQTVFSRWSFAHPNANFTNAVVSVALNGTALNLRMERLDNGDGLEDAIVWQMPAIDERGEHPQPDADMRYQVTISNVVINHQPRSFTYEVVVFDAGPVLRGVHSDYMVSYNNNVLTLSDRTGRDGVQTVKNPTRVDFTDASLAFDIEGNAGKAYRLYRAAFDRRPDVKGLGFWIGVMDQGMTIHSVAREFAQSAEFATLYGRAPTHEQILRALYRNVLHREPDEAGKAYWARVLASGGTLEQLLVEFSESAENKGQVAGEVHSGILYEQYGSK